MTPRAADRLLWALLAATVIVATLVAVTGCHTPRPGYTRPVTVGRR